LELETIENNVQKHAATTGAKVQMGLEGQEHFGEKHQTQLEIYIATQQNQM
jgi:hypothetical protein